MIHTPAETAQAISAALEELATKADESELAKPENAPLWDALAQAIKASAALASAIATLED